MISYPRAALRNVAREFEVQNGPFCCADHEVIAPGCTTVGLRPRRAAHCRPWLCSGLSKRLPNEPTSTYWLVGERLVRHEQGGAERASYGAAVVKHLSHDLVTRFGRGFSERNLELMRQFYLQWPNPQTVSADSGPGEVRAISQTPSA